MVFFLVLSLRSIVPFLITCYVGTGKKILRKGEYNPAGDRLESTWRERGRQVPQNLHVSALALSGVPEAYISELQQRGILLFFSQIFRASKRRKQMPKVS